MFFHLHAYMRCTPPGRWPPDLLDRPLLLLLLRSQGVSVSGRHSRIITGSHDIFSMHTAAKVRGHFCGRGSPRQKGRPQDAGLGAGSLRSCKGSCWSLHVDAPNSALYSTTMHNVAKVRHGSVFSRSGKHAADKACLRCLLRCPA